MKWSTQMDEAWQMKLQDTWVSKERDLEHAGDRARHTRVDWWQGNLADMNSTVYLLDNEKLWILWYPMCVSLVLPDLCNTCLLFPLVLVLHASHTPPRVSHTVCPYFCAHMGDQSGAPWTLVSAFCLMVRACSWWNCCLVLAGGYVANERVADGHVANEYVAKEHIVVGLGQQTYNLITNLIKKIYWPNYRPFLTPLEKLTDLVTKLDYKLLLTSLQNFVDLITDLYWPHYKILLTSSLTALQTLRGSL